MTPARIIPERLAERIATARLSYSAVARELGVKQPTISRLVKGEQGSTARIDQLARIVSTTPAYLTGETDDPDTEQILPNLTSEQRQLLACFDSMDRNDREMLLAMAMRLAERNAPGRVHARLQSYDAGASVSG